MRTILGVPRVGAGTPPPVKCGFNFFENSIDVTPTAIGSYEDINISAHVPGYATGAIVEVLQTTGNWNRRAYLRKKGSTDHDYGWGKSTLEAYGHVFYIVGLNGDLIFEAIRNYAEVQLWLVGYCDDYVTMFTNRIDVSTGTTGSWVDTDVSAHVPEGATGVILQIVNRAHLDPDIWDWYRYYLRPPLQIYEELPYRNIEKHETHMAVCGVTAARHFEQWIEHTNVDIYLCGYFTEPIIFLASQQSATVPPGYGVWKDADCSAFVPEGACGVMLVGVTWNYGRRVAVRKKGSTDDRHSYSLMETYIKLPMFVGVDEDRKYQIWVEGSGGGTYVIGYSKEA